MMWTMRIMKASRRRLADERGVVVGFLVRTAIVFAIVGVILYETGQILMTAIHAHGAAGAAAQAASNEYLATQSLTAAEHSAVRVARDHDPLAKVISVRITQNGAAAVVTVVETANTLVVQHVGFIKQLGVLHATEEEAHATA